MPSTWTPRSEQTPEQRQASNRAKRDRYNDRKWGEGERTTAEGGVKKPGQQEDRNGHGRGGRGARGGGRGARGGRGASTTGQQLAISPATTQAPPPPPQLGESMGFVERIFDRALTALSNDRQEHLSTINNLASRLSTPLTQQTLPPPLPQQALPTPVPQQALPAPPQPLAIEQAPPQDSLAAQRLEAIRIWMLLTSKLRDSTGYT